MMEREALLRYPNMEDYDDVAWDLAYRESVDVVEHYSVDLFVSLLEKGLNSGEFTPESLTSALSHKGFTVVDTFESDNLFGPLHSGTVLQIETYEFYFASESITAFIAIRGSNPGNFHVIPVNESWVWNYHSYNTASVADRNKNGIDEILLVSDYWASGFPGGCGSNLSLYEWQGPYPNGQFENIAANIADVVMSTASGECERPWEFENANGVPIIKATSRLYIPAGLADCPRYEEWTLYQWNGQTYEWANEGVNSIEGQPKCTIGWANLAGGLNDEAVSLIETALSNFPLEVDGIWGPASEDYFRFKLGTWYALRGEKELAIKTLESVRDHPTNPGFTKASELATLYLTNYEAQGVNVACDAVRKHILEIAPHPVCCGYDTDTMLTTWGFANPRWSSFIPASDICEQEPSASQPASTVTLETDPWSFEKQEQAITQIEQTLFKAGNSVQARMALLDLLDTDLIGMGNEGKVRSYLLYLLALTYELSGDESTAVDLYWQLWNEYPDSPYALVIRHKLELAE